MIKYDQINIDFSQIERRKIRKPAPKRANKSEFTDYQYSLWNNHFHVFQAKFEHRTLLLKFDTCVQFGAFVRVLKHRLNMDVSTKILVVLPPNRKFCDLDYAKNLHDLGDLNLI